MSTTFVPCATLPESSSAKPLGIAISGHKFLCEPPSYRFLWEGDYFEKLRTYALSSFLIGTTQGRPCYAMEVDGDVGREMLWCSLRSLLENVDRETFVLASRAFQILEWSRNHRYCGRCGAEAAFVAGEHASFCDRCQLQFYPRISPCVIVVVTRGSECLLARNAAWAGDWYSALAGFVEAGESIEQAIHREVREEVGLGIGDLRYFGSESWPFPGQLMLGFYADYREGEIVVDGDEIADARWWRYDQLPNHPGTISISGRLIKQFVDTRGAC